MGFMRLALGLAMVCGAKGSVILSAEFSGILDYGFYRGNELVLAAGHQGRMIFSPEEGRGVLHLELTLSGGRDVDRFGGVGRQEGGSINFFFPPVTHVGFFDRVLELPEQPYYWGGDKANMVHLEPEGPFRFGPFCIGCGSTHPIMLSLYHFQGRVLLNFWTDSSEILGERYYSGDMVQVLTSSTHTPEPSSWDLILIGLLLIGVVKIAWKCKSYQ